LGWAQAPVGLLACACFAAEAEESDDTAKAIANATTETDFFDINGPHGFFEQQSSQNATEATSMEATSITDQKPPKLHPRPR